MTQASIRAFLSASAAMALLSGCVTPANDTAKDSAAPVARAATSTRLVERDVEAPQVFQATDQALWDGRPSLGGVWVASPVAVDPERVIIRNPGNGKFVIGALFRRERLNPGPALQISSDAAAALGLLAGQPAQVSVTALRREEAAEVPAPDATTPLLDSAEPVETTALAAAAIDRAEAKATTATPTPAAAAAPRSGKSVAPAATAPVTAASLADDAGTTDAPAADAAADTADVIVQPAAEPAPKPRKVPFWKRKKEPEAPLDARIDTASLGAGPTAGTAAPIIPVVAAPLKAATAPALAPGKSGGALQIGIFAVEENARRAVDALAKGGVASRILTEASQGKTFWRVVADPAGNRAATLDKVKAAGFADAYFVGG